MTSPTVDTLVLLRGDGVSVLLDLTAGQLPGVAQWGADLGELTAAEAAALVQAGVHPIVPNIVDEPVRVALLPEHRTGWVGRPGLSGSRAGRDWSPRFRTAKLRPNIGRTLAAVRQARSARRRYLAYYNAALFAS